MSSIDDIIRARMARALAVCQPCSPSSRRQDEPRSAPTASVSLLSEASNIRPSNVELPTSNDNDEAEPETVDSDQQGGSFLTSVDSLVDETSSGDEETQAQTVQVGVDDWLKRKLESLPPLEFPVEEIHENLIQDVRFDEPQDDGSMHYGRRSATDGKLAAFFTPIAEALRVIFQPCNNMCYLSGYCAYNLPGRIIMELRTQYYGEEHEEAPKDKARAEKIMAYLRLSRQDSKGNLVFNIEGHDVCIMAFLRILGATSSVDYTHAPGQWQRLIKGFLSSDAEQEFLLNEKDIELDAGMEFTQKKGHAKTFIHDLMLYYSETLPTVSSDEGDTQAMQIPYRTMKDVYFEYEFHCHAFGIGKDQRSSYSTFCRAFNELYDKGNGVVKLMGGKSGFQTCAICNKCLSIKKSACCKRDLITKDCLQKLLRLHLLQQSTERQHAEYYIAEAKKLQNGQPIRAYIDIDPQSAWAGNTPKMDKDRTSKENSCLENRNIGARVVCGPIDEYISICTDNLIPHGANVLVEVTKFCIEYIANHPTMQALGMMMPRKIGIQFDNSGENKVKTLIMFILYNFVVVLTLPLPYSVF
jgi:hypothetical protein